MRVTREDGVGLAGRCAWGDWGVEETTRVIPEAVAPKLSLKKKKKSFSRHVLGCYRQSLMHKKQQLQGNI